MKRILLVDSSPAVEETLALLLGRDYEVIRRDGLPLTALVGKAAAGADLVIAGTGSESLMAELTHGDAAVLFLGDSNAPGNTPCAGERTGYLAKPFNPYQLKAAVEGLLNRNAAEAARPAAATVGTGSQSYLEFPFIGRTTAQLARRFASLSLPVLIWGELGCGQDRVARAMLGDGVTGHTVVTLQGMELTVDYLAGKRAQLAAGPAPAVLIEGLDRLSLAGQSMLLEFLDSSEGSYGRLIATANADLLERVYRGDFLERLYHRAATLTLPLAPLRRRRADVPALARWIAAAHAAALGMADIRFTPAAIERLCDYLWFGNVAEFDMVIGRTLAIYGRGQVDAADLVFDVAALLERGLSSVSAPAPEAASTVQRNADDPAASHQSFDGAGSNDVVKTSSGFRLLVHELAHELKNPMVTIKTFAQLLAERYDDASFRSRFHDVVDGDIERMDAILKVMSEFAGFDQPRKISIALNEHLGSTLAELDGDCAKRQLRVGWKGNGHGVKIMADAAQLQYALKNTLLAVLSQARTGSEIELALGEQGALTISYLREGERIHSLANYLGEGVPRDGESLLPLRIMLAKEIVERAGGRFDMGQADGDREVVTMEFPVG